MATPQHRQCSICLEDFKQPKFLDCFHTFCLECLRGLETKTPGFINCPLCQREIQLPSGGVDKLTTNFYIQVGVEDGETGPREVGQLQRGIDSQPATGKMEQVGRDQTVNEVKVVPERKTIKTKLSYGWQNFTDPFNGVYFEFILYTNKTDRWGETLALKFKLLKSKSPFVLSCQVEYDIILVNQKDKKFSTKQTGQGNIQTSNYLSVDLIKKCHATDSDLGFLFSVVPIWLHELDTKAFELDIDMTVSNIKYLDFNLK